MIRGPPGGRVGGWWCRRGGRRPWRRRGDVNLFIASVLTWPGRGITVRQDTNVPESNTIRLAVTGSGPIDLRLRIAGWASGATVRVDGNTAEVAAGQYTIINRTWSSGDVVSGAYGTNNPSAPPLLYTATARTGQVTLPPFVARIEAPAAVPTGTWTHVAVTQSGNLGIFVRERRRSGAQRQLERPPPPTSAAPRGTGSAGRSTAEIRS